MNIVWRELKASGKSLFYWSIAMIAFVVMMFAEFAAYYKNPKMLEFIEAMPTGMLEAFGMDNANLTTVSGYVSVSIPFINLALGVFALLLGNSIIAKEERDKTAGFLMTLPVTRQRVITGKLTAAVLSCAILLSIVVGSVLISTLPYEVEGDFPLFMLLVTVSTFMFKLIFLSLGMFLAAVTRRHKISGSAGVGLIFALYIASVIAGLSEHVSFLKYVTPFGYFETAKILRDMRLEPIYLGLSAALIVSALIGAYLVYGKRDLYI